MAAARARLTLGQFFVLCLVALAVLLAGLLTVLSRGSRGAIIVAAGRVMERASRRVTDQIEAHLGEAERVVGSFEARLGAHLVQPKDPLDVQRALVAEMVTSAASDRAAARASVSEVSFTYGRADGYHDGQLRLRPEGRGQVTVSRDGGVLWGRRVFQSG